MAIKLILAIDQNNGLGYKNDLLFRIPADLKRFKKLTEGHHVLMGSRTYESLPVDKLPNRINTVLTRQKNYSVPSDVFTVNSVETVLNHYLSGIQDKDLWVIGGASLYSAFLPYADEVYLTFIDKAAESVDTYFDRARLEELFYMTSFTENYCEKNDLNFYYVTYKNKEHFTHHVNEFK